MGSDREFEETFRTLEHFNPRSPRGERPRMGCNSKNRCQFQSTLPAWGATTDEPHIYIIIDISIHAPRVGSDVFHLQVSLPIHISIHAPRVGSDAEPGLFQVGDFISIHAPRVGSDIAAITPAVPIANFNPRSPRGERPD